MSKYSKLWGGAYTQQPSQELVNFTAGRDTSSLPAADQVLIPYDILGSMAHCTMLIERKIVPKNSGQQILKGLQKLQQLSETGDFVLNSRAEDVHSAIEYWLIDYCGEEHAGWLHTARSRNDQAAVDMKLYLRDQVVHALQDLLELIKIINTASSKHAATRMPGFTHHQPAMITTWGSVLQSYGTMFARDWWRLLQWLALHNTSPLGAMAGYGTSFTIDKNLVADLLGFNSVEKSGLDAVGNRWEPVADYVFALSSLLNHFSSLGETIMLLSMPQLGWLTLDEELTTGSSVMPHKKNPDVIEVIKAKASYVQGQLMSALSLGRSSFAGYNREQQWTKYVAIDSTRESLPCISMMCDVINHLGVSEEKMKKACEDQSLHATLFMENMVQTKNVSMRKAKKLVEEQLKRGQKIHQFAETVTDDLEPVDTKALESRLKKIVADLDNANRLLAGKIGGIIKEQS